MKIATLNAPIKHERNPQFDNQRFDALAVAMDEFIADLEEECVRMYIYSHLAMLRYIAPVIDLVIADDLILIVESTQILTVERGDMNRTQITKALICAVKGAAL